MATFSGGETLVNQVQVRDTNSTASGTKYTVPAGTYAKVWINVIKGNSSGVLMAVGDYLVQTSSAGQQIGASEDYSTNTREQKVEFLLAEGQTITQNTANSTFYSFLVLEFNKP